MLHSKGRVFILLRLVCRLCKVEYGVGLGAGVELFSHLQLSVRYFWNLGNVYDFSWKTLPNGKCNGITASLAFLF